MAHPGRGREERSWRISAKSFKAGDGLPLGHGGGVGQEGSLGPEVQEVGGNHRDLHERRRQGRGPQGGQRAGRAADAGVRLEIPTFLQPSLKALEAVSYNLMQKHSDIRRNIEFDDGELDLVLDFCTSSADGGPWWKVRPAQAKVLKQKLLKKQGTTMEVTSDELEQMLGESSAPGSFLSGGMP